MSWANLVKGAVSQVKDSGASAAIQRWLAREMADYGEVVDFSLNSRERSAHLRVLLKGERDSLTVAIHDYQIESSGDDTFVVVRRAEASRDWVNAVLRNLVVGKRHKIPPQFSGMAKMVLNG